MPLTTTARKTIFCIVIFILLGGLSDRAETGSIAWYKELKEASDAAQKANKPMLIDFWADWCAPCKIMDAEVYSNAVLMAAVAQKMVAVRINFDMQQELARKYNVQALPHLVFTNSYGSELLSHHGFLEAEDLTAVIEALPADVSELNRLDRILQEDKNDFAALQAMGKQLRAAGLYLSSNEYYEKAIKNPAAKKSPAQRESILLEMGLNSLELKDGKQAVPIFERCLKEFPKSENRANFLLGLGHAYALSEKKDKARKSLETLLSQYPQSEASREARELLKSL